MSATTTWIGIEDGAYYLSGEDACVTQWATSMNLPPETQERMLGSGHQRHYPGTGQSIGELCAVAVGRLLDQSGLQPDKVGMLIHAHTLVTSVVAPPHSMVAALAKEMGMHHADAFSVSNLHCGSMIGALRIIRSLMAVEPSLDNVVVVTADTIRGPELWHNNQTFAPSDGAAAIWVKRDCRRNRIGAIEIENVADLHMGYMITPEQRRWYDMTSQIYTLRVIKRAIKRSALLPEEISKLVPYNVSKPGWQEIAKRINTSEGFVFDRNIADKGHAYCSDIIINLVDGGFLDLRDKEAIVASARGTTGVYAAFVLQAA
jgi:3-oxoacyl-[acyl-carrier-protein] synthase III